MSFKVKFWGTRGTIACPGPHHLAFGGNTSCVEVAMGGRRVIFDLGTGVRNLGKWFMRKQVKDATILLSHTHWDHIHGFPFFTPAFAEGYRFTIMAGHLDNGLKIENVLAGQMTHPFFPVPIDIMKARIEYIDFRGGDSFSIGNNIRVRTTALNHPDGATGYRLEYQGKSLCYITDTEHLPGKPDQNILSLVEGADLMIYDSTYTDAEFPAKRSWGHSTWQEGMRLARAANVKRLAIFHHDPDHEDHFMEEIEASALAAWSGSFVSRDNMRVNLL
jgi:phosphoribosyl 1,2-cyclic phosphodiesterase